MLAGLLTLLAMAAFIAGVAWAYSGHRRKEFDEASRLPLEDDDNGERR